MVMTLTKSRSKQCFKCGKLKELSAFYCHPEMKDGHLNKCKECTKEDTATNYRKNKTYYQKYYKGRDQKESRKKYATNAAKRFRKENPLKYKAHITLNNAIRDGKVRKPDKCSLCMRAGAVEGHHYDYSRPLDVVWLCSQCHTYIHKYLQQIDA